LIRVIRGQFKEGADFIKIYETGHDTLASGKFATPYQYTEAELSAALRRRRGWASVSRCTPPVSRARSMRRAPAWRRSTMPTIERRNHAADARTRHLRGAHFAIVDYFADHAASPAMAARERAMLEYHAAEFRNQLAAGVEFAMGSDVGRSRMARRRANSF